VLLIFQTPSPVPLGTIVGSNHLPTNHRHLSVNILTVYGHPSKKSYTFQILEQLKNELSNQHWNVEVSDLYAIDFQSDMTEEEYEREGFAKIELPIPNDVLTEHQKMERADCIIFLYPVWWSDCPAKLKGWFWTCNKIPDKLIKQHF
jgi:FMN-dependent NADH-azoreductase